MEGFGDGDYKTVLEDIRLLAELEHAVTNPKAGERSPEAAVWQEWARLFPEGHGRDGDRDCGQRKFVETGGAAAQLRQ